MSAPKLRLSLSPAARSDFSDLLLNTQRRWGKHQRFMYRDLINNTLGEITRYPEIGRTRDEYRPGLRSFPVGQHVIFYRIEVDVIRVDRILHTKMDAASELDV